MGDSGKSKMKRNVIRAFVFFVLLLLAVFALKKNSQKSTLNVDEADFQVNDTAAVTKVFLADKSGHTILLKRETPSKWIVNNSITAREDLVEMTLTTLKQIKVRNPVPAFARDNAIKEIATGGIKVEIYLHDELSKVFYIGQTTQDQLSTSFLMEGSETPYHLYLPGWDVNLRSRFFLNPEEWKSRVLFDVTPKQIFNLSIEYPNFAIHDFVIYQSESGHKLKDAIGEGANTEKLNLYLSGFLGIHIEGFIFQKNILSQRDSFSLITPDCIISIINMEKQKKYIKIYKLEDDPDRMVGLIGDERTMVHVQKGVFEKLMVKREFFNQQNF